MEILIIGIQHEGEKFELKNRTFKGIFEMLKATTYEFKYVVDGIFNNESEADLQAWNEFAGSENNVFVV